MQESIDTFIRLLQHPEFFYPLTAFFGLLAGSFLNVVISRFPQMMKRGWLTQCVDYLTEQGALVSRYDIPEPTSVFNLFWPCSHCPSCKQGIRPWHNIPLLSYLWLRGRCKYCTWKIPLRYPLVELLTTLLSLVLALHYGPNLQFAAALLLTWLLLALTFIDIDTQFLPDEINFSGLWLGLLLSIFTVFVSPVDAILGASLGYMILWLLYWGFKLITRKEGMGYGDFKLMALAGAWVGWQSLPLVILISSFTGAFWGLICITLRQKHKDHPLPFGPFIALALWVTLVYGDSIIHYYLRWVH